MQCLEFSKGMFRKRFGLGVTIAIEGTDPVDDSFRELEEAIAEWVTQRGDRAKTVTVTAVAPPHRHGELEREFERMFRGSGLLAGVASCVAIDLCLLDQTGRCYVEKAISVS